MSLFLCSHFQSLSEFIPSSTGEVSHGDCGWDALLMCANTYDPARFPLTGDGLAAIRDDAIAHGYADPNGAVNIPNLDRYLTDHGYPHRTVGYAQFDLAQLHTLVQGYLTGALKAPIILETSAAGAGLVEDEANVLYHFFALGGEDSAALDGDGATGGYLRGDGDAVKYNAWPGPKYPIATSWAEITKAGIIGYIILDGVPPVSGAQGGHMIVPAGWTDDPAHDKLSAPNGHFCVRGIRAFVLGYPGGWPADNLPREEEHPQHPMELGNPAIPDGVQQTFNRGVVEWIASDTPNNAGPKAGCFEMWTGPELQAYRQALAAAQKAASDAQAAASAAQQAASQAQAALASAQAQRDALSAQLATANGKIAAATKALS